MRRTLHDAANVVALLVGTFLAVYLIGAAFAGLDWLFPQPDANRQVTNVSYVQANGVIPSMRYAATADQVNQTADAPQCIYKGDDLFNPGATDNQLGPGKKIRFMAGGPNNQRMITIAVPEGKIVHVPGSSTTPRTRFVYEKLTWFYDHSWDPLIDRSVGGIKGAISNCMAGLAPAEVMRIGLKHVIVYDLRG